MTKEEFAKKLKTLQIKKVVSVNGARGYTVDVPLPSGKTYALTCYGSPDKKAKQALEGAWKMMLKELAKAFGYEGDLTAFE